MIIYSTDQHITKSCEATITSPTSFVALPTVTCHQKSAYASKFRWVGVSYSLAESLLVVRILITLCLAPLSIPFIIPRELEYNFGLEVVVKTAVRLRRLVKALILSAHNEPWLCLAGLDQLQQCGNDGCRFDTTALHGDTLFPPQRHGKVDTGREGCAARRAFGVGLGKVHADDTDAPVVADHLDRLVDHVALLGLELGVYALEPDAVAHARHAVRGELQHLGRRAARAGLAKVDGDGADGAGLLETRMDMVDGVHCRGPAEYGAVGGQQADGPGAEDGDVVAWLEARKGDGTPARAEDIGQEKKLIVGDGRAVADDDERIVGERHTDILG